MADLQCVLRLIKDPLPKALASGLGKQVSALHNALYDRTKSLHLILIKTESHVACAGNNLVDAQAGFVHATTAPTYPIEHHHSYTLPIHTPTLIPEPSRINIYEQPDEDSGDHPHSDKYHICHYPQPITTISLRVAHSTSPDHTLTLAKRLLRDHGTNHTTAIPLHYPSHLNPGTFPPELQKLRYQGITDSLPLFPRTREYHRHLHKDSPLYQQKYQIPESYDLCLCGKGVETVHHLRVYELGPGLWPQRYPHESSTRLPRADLTCSETLLRSIRRHRLPNHPRPEPLADALNDTEHIAYLLQSLLPEAVWVALKSTTYRPHRAAAALQRAGLRLLQNIQTARNSYFHQIFGP